MKDEFIACPYCKTGQKEIGKEMCQKCYDEAMKGVECSTVRNHLKSCADCRKVIVEFEAEMARDLDNDEPEIPEGMCQSCGKEPINNADEDFCFQCKVGKLNL